MHASWRRGTALGRTLVPLLLTWPLAVLVSDVLRAPASGSPVDLSLLVPSSRRAMLLLQSVVYASGVAGISVVIAAAVATWVWSLPRRVVGWLRAMLLVAAPLPPYLHALAWNSLGFRLDSLSRPAGAAGFAPDGWLWATFIQVMALLPVAVLWCSVAFEHVEASLIQASRLICSDSATFRRVVLPRSRSWLLAAAAVLFLLTLTDYSIPALCQRSVYALEVFAEFSATYDSRRAFLVALPLVLVALAVVVPLARGLGRLAPHRAEASAGTGWGTEPRWTRSMHGVRAGATALVVAQLGVPLAMFATNLGAPAATLSAITAAARDTWFTLGLALAVAVSAVSVALMTSPDAGRGIRTDFRAGHWMFVLVPAALPPALIGAAATGLGGPAWLGWWLPAWALPVVALATRFAPLAALVLFAQGRHIAPALAEAAACSPVSRWRAWRTVLLPLRAPGVLAAVAAVLVCSLGEFATTLLVVPPGRATLAMRIYNYLHYGGSDTVAALGVLLGALITGIAALATASLPRWARTWRAAGGTDR